MRPISLCGVALAATLVALILSIGSGNVSSQAKPANVGSLKIVLDGAEGKTATTTLYQEGKVIASKDRRIGNRVEFENVPLGVIEIRCESPMLKTVIRRALLKEDDRNQELIVTMVMGEGTTSIGFGPSVHELETRIQKLEAAVATLQGK